ncbi:MAG: glycosyltransferase family 4 protein, partial [Verrucomicrobiota bacterium]
LHREGTVQEILRRATAVIVGNEFLADYARQFAGNVTVVPSAVELARYRRGAGTTVGWIGSRSTLPYLRPLVPVFQQLGITPRVISAGSPDFPSDFRSWQMETEVDELAQLGIGVAPLPDNPWERGKCAVKILQYMACGLPVVASPVGVQRELVRDGVTGFHATTSTEWRDRLQQLLADAALRQRLGTAGRELVAQCYNVPVVAARVAKVMLAV